MTAEEYIKNKIKEVTADVEIQYARYNNKYIKDEIRDFAHLEYISLNHFLDGLEKDLKEIGGQ